MKFTVAQIHKSSINEPMEFEGIVDVSELETMNNDIRRIDPAQVHVTFIVEGEEIIASMKIKGEMILPCARTLVDVPYPYQIEESEVFTTSPYYTNEDEDNEIHSIKGEVLDLKPYIMENILLAVPFRVFTDEVNPEGAAPTAGEGWQFVQEEIKEKTIDPRLKKLESLLENRKKENE
ncbi:YceD family protein [Oceanobacillus sp. FSL H7-0719]|uniref:YceD family protein n=1 Tax=Oceanobacillus sp. FSL H7-0719 TaxID=2954507 RepID=UPI003256892E